MKRFTSDQLELLYRIESWTSIKLNAKPAKKKYFTFSTDGLQQTQIDHLIRFGEKYGNYRIEPAIQDNYMNIVLKWKRDVAFYFSYQSLIDSHIWFHAMWSTTHLQICQFAIINIEPEIDSNVFCFVFKKYKPALGAFDIENWLLCNQFKFIARNVRIGNLIQIFWVFNNRLVFFDHD